MKLVALLTLSLFALLLSGCIGEPLGCAGVVVPTANPQYSGHFTGAFTDGLVPMLTFDFELANDGLVTGTVHSLAGADAPVTGDIRDWENCDQTWTAASLSFTFAGQSASHLSVTKGKGQSEPWVFSGHYAGVDGHLQLSRQANP